MLCGKGKIKLQSLKGNQTDKVHDTGNFGAFSRQNCDDCLVVTIKTNSPVSPRGPSNHAGEVNWIKLLPGNTYSCSGVELVGGKPFSLKSLIVEEGPVSDCTRCIGVQMDLGG